MTKIIRPGSGVLFMKVGTHAKEGLADIISRKSKEIDDAGFSLWGYGGNTCHPRTMVQPFADIFEQQDKPIHLVMEEMNSRHFAEQVRAEEYSSDGIVWKKIPDEINVLGSRFALVLKSLSTEEHKLSLNQTRVPVGPNAGRLGSRYIRGQVDKACLEVLEHPELSNEEDIKEVDINLVAEMEKPYAVFLRNSG
ncbi:MAG: hypothetical protein P1U83_17235 [Roseovarius sp.]|nr:hypothetical protein [Roseovarius sp.]